MKFLIAISFVFNYKSLLNKTLISIKELTLPNIFFTVYLLIFFIDELTCIWNSIITSKIPAMFCSDNPDYLCIIINSLNS